MTPEQYRSVKKLVVTALCIAGIALGGYEGYEHLAKPAQASAAQGSTPAAGPDVSFTVGSGIDTRNGGMILNEGVFPAQTKTAYIAPEAKGTWTAASAKGHIVTIKGVPLTNYHNAKTGKDSPEYKVTAASQIEVR